MTGLFHIFTFQADASFGRDVAQFHRLLVLMTTISLVLWALVVLTLALRNLLRHTVYRQSRYQPAATVAPKIVDEE